ncbi:hypothetical protein [Nocardia sp. NPDC004260]
MRIRSIKPDFWRSKDISDLTDWNDRLIFIGLWSYVDDNGVGLDRLSLITTDLFADDVERDPHETFARVSRGLQNLAEAGRIVRYTVDGKDYLSITNWKKHQRVDKPNKARFPGPTSDDDGSRETVATPSRDSPEIPAPGAVEQGSSGTEEQKKKRAPAKPDAAKPKAVEQVVAERAYERVGKALNFMATRQIVKWAIHERGADPDTVENAIVSIYRMGKPITRQVVGQFLDGHFHANTNGISRADQKVQGYLEMGARLTSHSDEPKEITR